jgi:hypothetical protein
MSLTKVTYSMIQGQYVNVIDEGVSTTNTASQNYDILQNIIRNAGGQRKLIYWPHGTYQLDVFNPNNCVIIGDDVTLQFTYNATKSTTMGQFTNCEISGFTFQSLEADLSFQYCTAEKTTFNDCKFIGWRNPTGSNAWGLHLSFQKGDVRVINCGFQDNTQSDIAIVDGCQNILIQNCYAIDPVGDPLHINVEPNASNFYNSVLIETSTMGKLDLREDGTGGTSSKAITVNNCTIAELTYDGAFAVFNSCRIASIGTESIRYGGQVSFNNSLGLGVNLIADPYLMVNAFNQAQALSNNQIWYMRNRGGAVTAGGRVNNNVNGFRYFSLNEAAQNGVISYSLATNITITAGKTYCVALTARRIRGTGANHLIILDGGTSINTRSQRQSNLDNNEFTTELFFFTAVNTALNFIVQNDANNSTAGIDIKSISVHEVIFDGYAADKMLARVHDQTGVREVVLPALPATNPADQTGLQVGDRVTVLGGKTYSWDGSALQALW